MGKKNAFLQYLCSSPILNLGSSFGEAFISALAYMEWKEFMPSLPSLFSVAFEERSYDFLQAFYETSISSGCKKEHYFK